jgi:acyl carrier protein
MTDDQLTTRIIQVIAQTQKLPAESIRPDSTFQELGIDSLDGINIVFALESEFGINIPDDDLNSIRSIPDVIAGVRKLLSQSGSEHPSPA